MKSPHKVTLGQCIKTGCILFLILCLFLLQYWKGLKHKQPQFAQLTDNALNWS